MRARIVYIGKGPGVSVGNLGGQRPELFYWFWIPNVHMNWIRDINTGHYTWPITQCQPYQLTETSRIHSPSR